MVEGKTPWLGMSRVERVFAEGTSRGGVKRKSPNHGPVPRDVLEVVRVHVCVCDSVLDPLALLMTFTVSRYHVLQNFLIKFSSTKWYRSPEEQHQCDIYHVV
jgi:hypothetical protein